jgi:hypothetical protein
MSHKFLKIKIKYMANEAQIIRFEENKTKKEYRYLSAKQGREAEYQRALQEFWDMRRHRTFDLRCEARSTLVAYGFIRGKSYATVENAGVDNPPDWGKVLGMITKYGTIKDRLEATKALKKWTGYDANSAAGKAVLESIK